MFNERRAVTSLQTGSFLTRFIYGKYIKHALNHFIIFLIFLMTSHRNKLEARHCIPDYVFGGLLFCEVVRKNS